MNISDRYGRYILQSSNSSSDIGNVPQQNAATSIYDKLSNSCRQANEKDVAINHTQHSVVEKLRGPRKLVSGAQFRATIREPIKCEQCESLERLLHKSKETIRSLKLQISRLEDSLHSRNVTRQSQTLQEVSKEISDNLNLEDLQKEKRALSKRCSEYEKELQHLRREHSERCIAYETAYRAANERITSLERKIDDDVKAKENLQGRNALVAGERDLAMDKIAALEKQLLDAKQEFVDLERLCFPDGRSII